MISWKNFLVNPWRRVEEANAVQWSLSSEPSSVIWSALIITINGAISGCGEASGDVVLLLLASPILDQSHVALSSDHVRISPPPSLQSRLPALSPPAFLLAPAGT